MEQKLVYSTVVKLQARGRGRLPATVGRLAHGAFFDLIAAVEPDLAGALHGMERKPFTVSPLYGLEVARGGHTEVRMGQGVWLRFTLLQSELFVALTRYLLTPQAVWPTLQLGEVEFLITEVLTTPGSHEWAGYVDLGAISPTPPYSPLNQGGERGGYQITLDFVSPTVFSRGNRPGLGRLMEAFPAPDLVFGGLAKTWGNYLPGVFAVDEVREYARETVVVGEYKLESKVYRFWKQPQIGAVGYVNYVLKDEAELVMRQQLNLLAELSFFSGVGYKTAMGMGQTKRIRNEK